MKPPRFAAHPSAHAPAAPTHWQNAAARLGRQIVWLLVSAVFLVLESLVTARERTRAK